MKVAFIGLGIMGSRMATNLTKHGIKLHIYNRTAEAMKPLVEAGAIAFDNPGDTVQEADVVFSMLSTPEVVKEVILDEALDHMRPDSIWVDCSTVNPSFSKRAARIANQKQIKFLDAPVAGTKPHAENAELVFFIGGQAASISKISPYLEMMGKKSMHIGTHGAGSSFKMLVNMMLAQSMVIFSEAVALGEKLGINRDFLLETIPNLVVSAPFTKAKAAMIQEDNYEVQFPLEWMHKDLHLATITAFEQGQPLFLANLAKELFAQANQQGMGRLDFAAIHQLIASDDSF